MDNLGGIKQIWRDRFRDTREWMDEVFPRIYRDDEALATVENGKVVSSLLLRKYRMSYLGEFMQAGYVYGAATARDQQGRGLMSALMRSSLRVAHDRGDTIVCLKPARRRLYGFYSKFGFATVYYIDEQRYTAKHKFVCDESRYLIEERVYDVTELADAYKRLVSSRPSAICHDEADFRTILIDNEIDGGSVSIVRNNDDGRIVAVGFASQSNDSVSVRELVAEDDDCANAVLASFSKRYPDKMIVVEAYPERDGIRYESRGMARIVSAERLFGIMARKDPGMSCTIRLHDDVIDENDGIFRIAGGRVGKITDSKGIKADLDVSSDVMTAIAFSSPKMGEIFSLPTARPFMSLMLD